MSKAQSTHTAKPRQLAQKAAARTAATQAAACVPAKKAVVLGQVTASSGKTYQVLAPAVKPRHLSLADIELAVEMMVAAR